MYILVSSLHPQIGLLHKYMLILKLYQFCCIFDQIATHSQSGGGMGFLVMQTIKEQSLLQKTSGTGLSQCIGRNNNQSQCNNS